MAKKANAAKQPQGHCDNCMHSELMQWEQDPLIAKCDITQERNVAVLTQCSRWEHSAKQKTIQRFKKDWVVTKNSL